jgi:hypothetical protein
MNEDFLSRWARLKRESTADGPHPSEAETTDSASPSSDPDPAPATDVSSLPPIESISAESSVAAFLRAGVPDDLTRAALRTAWASDPAIRDFIGIAENQWDFNGEGTIPGFGALSAEEYARHLAGWLRGEGATSSSGAENTDEHEPVGALLRHDSTEVPPTPSAPASAPHNQPSSDWDGWCWPTGPIRRFPRTRPIAWRKADLSIWRFTERAFPPL